MSQTSEDRYPTLASSEYFEVWEDAEDGDLIVSFNMNGVTIAVERSEFLELARVIREAAEHLQSADGAAGR